MPSRVSLIILAVVVSQDLLPHAALALSCLPCDEGNVCPRPPAKCAYGRVLDACGCCKLCGNGPGEACGGEYQMLGLCGKGLECRSNHATVLRPEFAEGVCIHTRPWLRRNKFKKGGMRRGQLPTGLKYIRLRTANSKTIVTSTPRPRKPRKLNLYA